MASCGNPKCSSRFSRDAYTHCKKCGVNFCQNCGFPFRHQSGKPFYLRICASCNADSSKLEKAKD